MKRFLTMIMVVVMAISFTACGSDGEEAPETPAKGETVTQAPENSEQITTEDEEVTPLNLYKVYKMDSEWDLCDAKWQNIFIAKEDADNYPELVRTLEDLNISQDVFNSDWMYAAKEDALQARDDMGEYFYTFFVNSEYFVQRADNYILSIREDYSDYYGGVHGMYGTYGHVFDTKTGERLSVADVLTDIDILPALLAEKLEEKYAEDLVFFDEDLEEVLSEYAPEEFMWTIDYQGITFYFNPYELASYAAGRLTVFIQFDEYPELFEERFTKQPEEGYIMEIPVDGGYVEIDITEGDGTTDEIYLQAIGEDEYDLKQLSVYKNGQIFTDPDFYACETMAYIVYHENRYYVLAEGVGYNDYTFMTLYDVQDDIFVSDILEATGANYPRDEEVDEYFNARIVLNDPTDMKLDTMVYMLGTMVGTDTYEFTDGKFDKDNIYYKIPEEISPLVSKVPIEVYVVVDDEYEVVPEGTEFYFLRTDNESYVDMRMDDGRDCRIEVGFDGWNRTVNDISEYDVFDGILYAG